MLRKLLILSALLLAAATLWAQIPAPMQPARLVNDFAGLLTPDRQAALERKLVDFDRETSTQIAIVTVTDLAGYDGVDFAQRLHEQWGVGGRGKDNGIVVLVKPRNDAGSGQAAISVGYGLEGVVPDITAGRIIDNEMLPAFREGDWYRGLDAATEVLMRLTRGEFTADEYAGGDSGVIWAALFGFGFFVLIAMLIARSHRRGGGNGWGSNSGGGGWIPPVMGGFGSGRSGGFGGGGFGGFGGGISGGGGAGRSF